METIKTAVALVGGVTHLAKIVGVSQQAVHAWKTGKAQISARHAAKIEVATAGHVTALAIGQECAALLQKEPYASLRLEQRRPPRANPARQDALPHGAG